MNQINKIRQIMKDEPSEKVIPFGKYAGEKLSDIPLTYLRWIGERDVDAGLKMEIEKEVERRGR